MKYSTNWANSREGRNKGIERIIGEIIIIISILTIINNHRNYLLIIISLELIIISISYIFVYYSIIYDDILGIISTIILLVIGAAETAIGITFIMLIP